MSNWNRIKRNKDNKGNILYVKDHTIRTKGKYMYMHIDTIARCK